MDRREQAGVASYEDIDLSSEHPPPADSTAAPERESAPQKNEDEEKEFCLKVPDDHKRRTHSLWAKFLANLLYFGVSLGMTLFNKAVLTTFHFRFINVLLLCQNVLSIAVLEGLKALKLIDYPQWEYKRAWQVLPLSLYNFLRIITGLAGLAYLNIPTNSALLRVGTVFTLMFEYLGFGWTPTATVTISVVLQVVGAFVASWNDMYLTFEGVCFVLLSNVFAAAYLVEMKRDLEAIPHPRPKAKQGGPAGEVYSLMIYQSLTFLPLLMLWVMVTGDVANALHFFTTTLTPRSVEFELCFCFALLLGALLVFSSMVANQYTSPLTVTVTSNVKNISADLSGMALFPDVTITPVYLLGLAVSVVGAVLFSVSNALRVSEDGDSDTRAEGGGEDESNTSASSQDAAQSLFGADV
ncbi:unnamed protein product [Vitrella brassicaformis CCMP3155]|uniref:Sugar phosphate transporter domain-containing protein n=2 Tax=Vitrella brassicaformis TaxID=1169539 RepID=A0A0G4FG14_VITBC|nr:unnamed protein product [Vitrella brassicaformis CCMP3155]|eukprot:CEM11793.1 unnamed protein product [Vitrella brassicaformis CCMP3155]